MSQFHYKICAEGDATKTEIINSNNNVNINCSYKSQDSHMFVDDVSMKLESFTFLIFIFRIVLKELLWMRKNWQQQ